jgi:hypothetical protein
MRLIVLRPCRRPSPAARFGSGGPPASQEQYKPSRKVNVNGIFDICKKNTASEKWDEKKVRKSTQKSTGQYTNGYTFFLIYDRMA